MSKTSVDNSDVEIDEANLDNILTEIGGFGRFQIITYILICIPNIISAATYVNFMISATTLDYRWANNQVVYKWICKFYIKQGLWIGVSKFLIVKNRNKEKSNKHMQKHIAPNSILYVKRLKACGLAVRQKFNKLLK